MAEPTTRRINRAGRPVWFVRSTDDSSTVRPVTREGVIACVLALLVIVVGGAVMMLGVVLLFRDFAWMAAWMLAMFGVVAAGLVSFAVVVSRHLP